MPSTFSIKTQFSPSTSRTNTSSTLIASTRRNQPDPAKKSHPSSKGSSPINLPRNLTSNPSDPILFPLLLKLDLRMAKAYSETTLILLKRKELSSEKKFPHLHQLSRAKKTKKLKRRASLPKTCASTFAKKPSKLSKSKSTPKNSQISVTTMEPMRKNSSVT